MGAFYSFGITFSTSKEADNCKSLFENYDFSLSDSTIINSRLFVNQCDYSLNNNEQFICSIFPEGLELPGANPKLLQAKYFYEIRNMFYQFLLNLNLKFNIAFFEFEGADFIQDNNPLLIIQDYDDYYVSINEYFTGLYKDEDFIQKKYLGGLVISESLDNKNNLNIDAFENFKIGYKWISI